MQLHSIAFWLCGASGGIAELISELGLDNSTQQVGMAVVLCYQ